MLKVGLTGGYATGKSFVAEELTRLGCHLIYADRLGHEALLPGGDAYPSVLAEFGPAILDAEQKIDRKKLAAIVFADASRLAVLNRIVHPAVFHLEEKMMQQIALKDHNGIVVIEAAILIEAKRDGAFDRIILTTCDPDVQIARGMNRDGVTRQQVLARLANQMSLGEKLKHAHYVVDTSGTKEETVRQVEEIYRELLQLTKAKLS